MLGTINLFCDASNVMMWVLVAFVAVAIIIMPILNRKKQKEANDMTSSIDIGDEIMTLGGIIGKVVAIDKHESGDKIMIVETGEGETKTKMTFSVRALGVNFTKSKQRQQELERQKAEKKKGKKSEHNVEDTVALDQSAETEAQQGEADSSVSEAESSSEQNK